MTDKPRPYDLSAPQLRRGRNPIDGPPSPYDCSVTAEERKRVGARSTQRTRPAPNAAVPAVPSTSTTVQIVGGSPQGEDAMPVVGWLLRWPCAGGGHSWLLYEGDREPNFMSKEKGFPRFAVVRQSHARAALAASEAEAARLRAIVDEVHAWIVCSAVASDEDMMQNASRIEEITRHE